MLLQKRLHKDHRGYVYEAWRLSEGFPCKQVTIVGCATGIWKGAHYHPDKNSIWACVAGRLLARVGDTVVPLRAGDGLFVYIPAGTTHDIMGLGKRNTLLELDSEEFQEGDKVRL